jgi:hypothetical protein
MAFWEVNPTKNPENFAETRGRLKHMMLGATDHQVERGRAWYDLAEGAAREGAKDIGVPHLAGAGMMSAVSPALDFSEHNVHVLHEMGAMRPEHHEMVVRSLAHQRRASEVNRLLRGEGQPTIRQGRLAEVESMLTELYPHLSRATDSNIVDAMKIRQGTNPYDVLTLKTRPKTHNFMLNLAGDRDAVTVDYRAADIISNQMRPVRGPQSNRGISSAQSMRGPTRYEDYAHVIAASSRLPSVQKRMPGLRPAEAQALQWVIAKDMELTNPDGTPRGKGPARKGQPYF